MAKPNSTTSLQVESIVFPPSAKPPGATNTLFLGGAGVRGLDIDGNFVKFSGIGVYLEYKAISLLAVKWKGKSVEELTDSIEFYRDIVTGPFEKFSQVTLIQTLTGKQFSEKVAENCVAIWKSQGSYTEADAKTIDKFLEIFKDQNFPPGSSILFTISLLGSLTITFSKDGSIPETGDVVIEDEKLGEAILESQIGKHGVSPATKKSLASRLYNLMNQKANDH
ncbi:putative chalcone isomerase [Helianthus annuus]|nr:putative chalcone isomerase [Helianthus annuus]KAJ0847255.1 putative chalcone isomerase [Helianthus annuus]